MIYKDISFNFVAESQEGTTSKKDEEAINQSIKNILFTQRGEVPFDPLFGSGLRNILFEKMSPITEFSLEQEIRFALENHEPRIVINNIDMEPNYNSNSYEVTIVYTINYLNMETSTTINLQMQGI